MDLLVGNEVKCRNILMNMCIVYECMQCMCVLVCIVGINHALYEAQFMT